MTTTAAIVSGPARDIYNRLGGPTKVAERLGISRSSVQVWAWPAEKSGFDGYIPLKYVDPLLELACEIGEELTAADIRPDLAEKFASPPSAETQAGAA